MWDDAYTIFPQEFLYDIHPTLTTLTFFKYVQAWKIWQVSLVFLYVYRSPRGGNLVIS